MQLRPAGWQVLCGAVVLAVAGIVTARPLAIVGAGGIAGLGLGLQAIALRAARRVRDGIRIAIDPERVRTTAGSTAECTLEVSIPRPPAVDLEIAIETPPGLDCKPSTVSLPAGRTTVETTLRFGAPEAGSYAVERAQITVADPMDSVAITFDRPMEGAVAVRAADATTLARDHGSGRAGDSETGDRDGIEPGRVRPYVHGDPVSRIDWKTSARHDDRFVRDPVTRRGQPLEIVLDRRIVPGDEASFRQRRDAALELIAGATGETDRVTVRLVGASGPTPAGTHRPADARTTVRRTRPVERSDWPRTPGRPIADRPYRPTGDDGFDRALAPFAAIDHIDDPLDDAIASIATAADEHRIVILTDDVDSPAVRRAARVADERGHPTLVVLSAVSDDDRLRADLDRRSNVRALWVSAVEDLNAVRQVIR
ncbi:MAG: DUF58 domain-containing protein [Halococcoides sp.]